MDKRYKLEGDGMNYISTSEAAKRWGVSIRQVQRLLATNQIPNALKFGKAWMIPFDEKNPESFIVEKGEPTKSHLAELKFETAVANLKEIRSELPNHLIGTHFERLFVMNQGNLSSILCYFYYDARDDAAKLEVCSCALLAAIWLGDFKAYYDINEYLTNLQKGPNGKVFCTQIELIKAAFSITVMVPKLVPEWLKKGDFNHAEYARRPEVLALRVQYLYNIGNFEAAQAIAETALTYWVYQPENFLVNISFNLLCGVINYYLGRIDETHEFLSAAIEIAVPKSIITPFVEALLVMGGELERCLQKYPDFLEVVVRTCKKNVKNWIVFHNMLSGDQITTLLSIREYHIAFLAVRKIPYHEIAEKQYISVGRLKNIMQEIYQKLNISSRDELKKFIFVPGKRDL